MRLLTVFLLLAVSYLLPAQPVIVFEELNVSFSSPVDVTNAGDGSNRLFVVERRGTIRSLQVAASGTVTADPGFFLDIQTIVRAGGERGLLGLAFHPDFTTNGYFYVNYTTRSRNGLSNGTTVISRFQVTSGVTPVEASTEKVIITINQPFGNHNAGDLAFGPDGYLYIPVGDGGAGGDPQDFSQNTQSLLGKMLRIDVDVPTNEFDYLIPPDNPFVGDANVLDEIWAIGLRNPWRISFDALTGDLWIGDVGQGAREEIDFQPANSAGGENYGWDCREGKIAFTDDPSMDCVTNGNYVDPIFDYNRSSSTGGLSITGGFVYRGPSASDLEGHYICADYGTNNFFIVTPDDADGRELLVQPAGDSIFSTSSFGQGENGDLYVLSLNGPMRRITSALTLPVTLLDWSATAGTKSVTLRWSTSQEDGAAEFILERSADGEVFATLTTLAAAGNSTTETNYQFVDTEPLPGESFYRLRQRDLDGSEEVFAIRSVSRSSEGAPSLQPNPAKREFSIIIPSLRQAGTVKVQLIDATGKTVYNRLRIESAGPLRMRQIIPELAAGLYRVMVEYDDQRHLLPLIIK